MRDPSWLTRAGSSTFQADQYRRARVLGRGLRACALPHRRARTEPGPAGRDEPGLEAGRGARSAAPPELLDSYEPERAPAGRAVIDDTLAQTALVAATGREGQALRAMLTGRWPPPGS